MQARRRICLGLVLAAGNALGLAAPAAGGGVAGPTALAASGRSLWVADSSGTLRRLDARTGALVASIRLVGYPGALAVDRRSVWAGTIQPGLIVRISRRTNRPVGAPIDPGGGTPLRLAAGANTLWVVNEGDDRVWRVDARTGATIGSTAVAAAPWQSAAVAADVRGAWVASTGSGGATLVRLDARGRIVARRRLPRLDVDALAISGSTLLAVAGPTGTLLRLRFSSGAQAAPPVAVGRDPTGLAVDGGRVWVSSLGPANGLREVDILSGRTVAGPRRAPGRMGRADDIVLAGGALWASNAYGIVSRLDPHTGAPAGRPLRVP